MHPATIASIFILFLLGGAALADFDHASDAHRTHAHLSQHQVRQLSRIRRQAPDGKVELPFALLFASVAMEDRDAAGQSPATPPPADEPTPTIHFGPGIVVPRPTDAETSSPPKKHPYPAPVHKLIVVVVIIAAFGIFTLLLMLFTESRASRGIRSLRKKGTLVQLGDPSKDNEKPKLSVITANLRFPPPSYARRNVEKAVVGTTRGLQRKSRVLDITSEVPRSKFSVTSSDYPYSSYTSRYSSSTSDSSSSSSLGSANTQVPVFVVENRVSPSQLLSPAEFFSLPSPRESSEELRRSRTLTPTPYHARSLSRPPSLSPIPEEYGRNGSITPSPLGAHTGQNYGRLGGR